jgi:CMP-N-acetylneuraminic acid synthetase
LSFCDFKILAVVPARGGSKSIPRKNLAELGGRSLVARAGDVCMQLDFLDAAVLSTDDAEIANAGKASGLSVPFFRPPEFSGDSAGSLEMWQHAWKASEEAFGIHFDLSVLLEPTSPLRRASFLYQPLISLHKRRLKSIARAIWYIITLMVLSMRADKLYQTIFIGMAQYMQFVERRYSKHKKLYHRERILM